MRKQFLYKLLPTLGLLVYLGFYYGLKYMRHYNSTLVSANREATKSYNKQVNQLLPVMDSLKASLKDLRVYTNDKGRLRLHLRANMDVYETLPISFVVAQAEADVIQDFLKNRSSRGFDLFLESDRDTVLLMNLTQNAFKKEQEWKIVGSYYLDQPTKDRMKKKLKSLGKQYDAINLTVDSEINRLNSLQTEIATVSESELKNKKLKSSLTSFLRVYIGESGLDYQGYIATYNKTTSKEEFKNILPELRDMFFKYPNSTSNYNIRELEIVAY